MSKTSPNFFERTGVIPLALLLLLGAAFGLLIPWLGFYWDDWPVIFMTRWQGAEGFLKFYQYDRPISAWTYLVSAPLLGVRPLAWHLFSLLLRWLAALGLWWSLRGLWPARPRLADWTALLFAVYPAFTQQSIAVAYSQHWICFGLYFLSLGSMIAAVRRPRAYLPLTVLGVLSGLLSLLTMEYFLGLELLRPVVLWFLVSESPAPRAARLRKAFLHWLPYLAALAGFVVWRLFFLELAADDPNRPALLFDLLSRPLGALLDLAQMALQDSLHILVAAWYPTLQPANLLLSDRFYLVSLAVGALTAVLLAVFLTRRRTPSDGEGPGGERAWLWQAAALGGLALFLGPFPAWLTGKQALVGLYGSRFALAAMFGASLLMVAFLEWLTPRRTPKVILLSALIGVAVAFQLRTANEYRWLWTQQTRFYWQLAWRAPYLEPGTLVLSEGELFKYVGDYSTGMGINLLYPRQPDDPSVAYWFVDIEDTFTQNQDALLQGAPLEQSFRSFTFSGDSRDSLVISYDREEQRCLWVLDPAASDVRDLGPQTRRLAPLSNPERIRPDSPMPGYPPAAIFGAEPAHTWCYFYQKAELARQAGDWETLVSLGEQAREQGHTPNDYREWLPFIEGYAHQGRWERAVQLSQAVMKEKTRFAPAVCALWQRLEEQTPPGPEREAALSQVRAGLSCSP